MKSLINIWKSVARLVAWRGTRLVIASALAAILVSAMGLTALAQQGGNTVRGVPNIVLVHGAWADGTSWSPIIVRLQKAGYNVTAVQMPLNSVYDDAAKVRTALAMQTGPTLLVAHSYGGEVISQLGADAPNVVGLVYIAAFGPDEGESGGALLSAGPPSPAVATLHPDKAGYLYLSEEGFLKHFATGVDLDEARVLYAAQKPINSAIFNEKLGPVAWKSFPTWYLLAENDETIPPTGQHFMAERMGAKISTIQSGHLPMLTHPDEVTALIEQAASSLIPDPRPNVTTTLAPAAPTVPGSGSQTFPETGKTVRGIFLDYWKAHGGLAQQGYPISDLLVETSPTDGKPYTVQYFERAVFEYHPENDASQQVLLSLLGTFRYKERYSAMTATR